jgi:hypothetical protein
MPIMPNPAAENPERNFSRNPKTEEEKKSVISRVKPSSAVQSNIMGVYRRGENPHECGAV